MEGGELAAAMAGISAVRVGAADDEVRVKALVTGAKGFVGKNLVVALRRAEMDVVETDADSSPDALLAGVRGAAVVFHLAGVNRPEHEEGFETGNVGSMRALVTAVDQVITMEETSWRPLIMLSSSVQAEQDNPYGRSKLAAERELEAFGTRTGTQAVIYRLPGVFGKWCRPNYNSVVATLCHNVARGLPVVIADEARVVELVYIDDVVAQFMTHLKGPASGVTRGAVHPIFKLTLGELAGRIRGFHAMRESLDVPDMTDPLTRRLLGTYTSYLPPGDLAYRLERRSDGRGTVVELLKSAHLGQVFLSRTHPGVTRGNHVHDLKVEKFCVLEGDAVIRLRPILGDEVTEHRVTGTDFKVVDIPPGMTHSIENVGSVEMIVLFWASEVLDRERPDTYFNEVVRG